MITRGFNKTQSSPIKSLVLHPLQTTKVSVLVILGLW